MFNRPKSDQGPQELGEVKTPYEGIQSDGPSSLPDTGGKLTDTTLGIPLSNLLPDTLVSSQIPEKYRSRFDACMCATSPLALYETRLGWTISQVHEAEKEPTHFPLELWGKDTFEYKVAEVLKSANPRPDLCTIGGRFLAKVQKVFGPPPIREPLKSPELREVLLQMCGYLEQGRYEELVDVLKPTLMRTEAFGWMDFKEVRGSECERLIEQAFEWFSKGEDKGFGALAFRLASAKMHTGRYLKVLQGLVPGAAAEVRKDSAVALHNELKRKFDDGALWSVEQIASSVFLDPRNLGYLAFYICDEIPNKDSAKLAETGYRIGGRHQYLSFNHGALVSMTLTTLLQKVPSDTAVHEADHVVTAMHQKSLLGGMSFEGRILSEMRSQLGESKKTFNDVRQEFLEYYLAQCGAMAVVELDISGKKLNIDPNSPTARGEIERFIDRVEYLLNSGILRSDICGLLRRVESLPEFYDNLPEVISLSGITPKNAK